MHLIPKKNALLDQAMADVESGQVESLTLDEFNDQISE